MSSIIYNGHEIQDLIVNGNQAQLWLNGQKLYPSTEPGPVDPYNPLGLPPFTIRCKFTSGYTPSDVGDSQTLVDAGENVWDITKNSTNWGSNSIPPNSWLPTNIISVIGANTTGVTNMAGLFANHMFNLEHVAVFDTSNVTSMLWMFGRCKALKEIPILPVDSVTDVQNFAWEDSEVLTGSLGMYNAFNSKSNPPYHNTNTFAGCGSNTESGRAELAQIPTDWGGTYVPVSETYTVEFTFSQYDDMPGANFHVTSSSVSSSLPFYYQSSKGGAWNSLSSSEASDIINGTSSKSGYGLKIEGVPSWTSFALEATNEYPGIEEVDMAATIKVTSSTRGVILNDSDSWGTLGMFGSVTVNIDSNMSTTWTWQDSDDGGDVEDPTIEE